MFFLFICIYDDNGCFYFGSIDANINAIIENVDN